MKTLILSLVLLANVETVAVLNKEVQFVAERVVKCGRKKRNERRASFRKCILK